MAVAALVSGSALLGLTGTASADPNASTIGFGHSTNTHAVWCVQHDLNCYMTHHPVNSPAPYGTIAEHGEWGNQTYNTVKWFQSEFYGTPGQLDIDGIVGQMTGSDLLQRRPLLQRHARGVRLLLAVHPRRHPLIGSSRRAGDVPKSC